MAAEQRFWTPKEAARYLNVHPRTLTEIVKRRRSAAGKIKRRQTYSSTKPVPHVKWGYRTVRFPVEEFKKWAEGDYYAPKQTGTPDV